MFPFEVQSVPKYSSLVVFGDSYSDNGHNPLKPLQNPVYDALGNNSKGILWPNLLAKQLGVHKPLKLYDYAYNGAHANERLTNMGLNITDTRAQIETYLSQLNSGNITDQEIGVLYCLWIGINPIDEIWIEACDPERNGGKGVQYPSDLLFKNATRRISQQVEEIRYQVEHLRENAVVNKSPSSYMIITVPNVSVASLTKDLARKWARGDKQKEKDILRLLELLIEQYNKELICTISQIHLKDLSRHEFIDTYDVTKLWNSMLTHPEKYELKNVTGPCFENNTICSNIDEYLFWDYIHPTPRVEKFLAHDMQEFIMYK
ncbi:hypothetical protein CROQUDRAFT_718843, partial [Cronartium quercuum f. sp. fusiforme G11]